MSIDNRLAVLALIACDNSYRSNWSSGDPLRTNPDSKAIHGDLEPDPIPEGLMRGAGLDFTYFFKGAYRIEGWRVAASITNPETGFGAVLLQNDAKTEAIVAFTGTNGVSAQGLQGWYTDLTLARTQWNQDTRDAVLTAISRLPGPDELSGSFDGAINFTGQSLGGALAQYALYDYARIATGFDASRVTLTTFNALGVLDALSTRQDYPTVIGLLADVQTAHYTVYNDIVHRLGGGYLNGPGNTYQFKFTETVPGYDYYDEAGNRYQVPPREIAYDFVDAHRIESGFYRGFTKTGLDFASAKAYTPRLISAEAARSLADAFGNLLNDRDHSPAESFSRLVAGITASVATNPSAAREIASALLHTMTLQAASGASRTLWTFLEIAVPVGLQAVNSRPLLRAPLLAGAAYALAAAAAMDAGEEIGQTAANLKEYLQDALNNARLHSPQNVADFELAVTLIDGTSLIEQQTKATAVMAVASGTLPGLSSEFSALLMNDPAAALQAFQSESWVADFLRFVANKVYNAKTGAGSAADEVGRAAGEALVAVSKGIYALGSQVVGASDAGRTALQDLVTNLETGAVQVAKALSNAYSELTLKFTDAFNWGAAVSRWALDAVVSTFVAEARADTGGAGPSFEAAIEALESAAQTVVILPGREASPFNDESFDPDTAVASRGLGEGSLSTFTAYLPYEAGSGGQRVRLELGGIGVEHLSVLVDGEQIELEAEGPRSRLSRGRIWTPMRLSRFRHSL
jgi:hypothetical protein